ncbi:MAG: MFS transporter [Gammaproteobacteria bacterium]
MDISRTIREGDMTPFQMMAVAICLTINMVDGFDVLAISFAAPEIAREWALPPTELGVLFSAGLAGMVLGALIIGPLADRFGRRNLILICLFVISIGMLSSALAQNLAQLVPLRVLTGLGVGGMLASLNTIVAEYSSDRRRQLAISFLQSGYPVGGIIAGVASVYLIGNFGWRAVFVFGGTLSAAMIPLVLIGLPESLDYLLHRRGPGALEQVNKLLARLGHPALERLPDPEEAPAKSAVRQLFSAELRGRTFSMWISFLAVMCGWYFVINWTPKILVDAGLSLDGGISGGLLLSLGGVVGGLSLGFLAGIFRVNRLVALFMFMSVAAMATFGVLATDLPLMLTVAFLIGFFLAGSMIGLYAIIPDVYPTRVRSTGTGWAIGIGRLGAVLGPYLAGVLIAAGWERPLYYLALSLPLVLAMVIVLRLSTTARD